MFVYGKENIVKQRAYTYSTSVTTWWAVPVSCIYQYLMTSKWIPSTTITAVILQQFKELTAPKQVLTRSYVCILIESSLYTSGTVTCNTPVSWTLPTESTSSPSFTARYSIQVRPGYIERYPICRENYMNIFMPLYRNTQAVGKVGVKIMGK